MISKRDNKPDKIAAKTAAKTPVITPSLATTPVPAVKLEDRGESIDQFEPLLIGEHPAFAFPGSTLHSSWRRGPRSSGAVCLDTFSIRSLILYAL